MVTERLDQNMAKLRKYWFNTGEYQQPYPPPSWEEMQHRPLDLPISKVMPIVKPKPVVPAAILFPGQGSQYVGMLKDYMDFPAIKDMLTKATAILGWDPKEIMLNGPEAQLLD